MKKVESVRREYIVTLKYRSSKADVLLNFLIAHSDTLRLTRSTWWQLWPLPWKKVGTEKDPIFRRQLEFVSKEFIRKEVTNKKYNDIPQGNARYEHYYFKLQGKVKEVLSAAGLFMNNYDEEFFFGFEHPAFYKKGEMIAAFMSYTYTAILLLTEKEREELERLGLQVASTILLEGTDSCLIAQ
ncbi:MAG TPA: hypothetical protein VGE59_01940 [Patescibacteria group bacterium]